MAKTALILEDHKLFAETMSKTLIDYGFFSKAIVFSNHQALLKYLINYKDNNTLYFFLDYYVGKSVLPPLLQDLKRLLKNPKVIIISSITNSILLNSLLDFKPSGIIHKTDDIYELLQCLKEIEKGNIYYSEFSKNILNLNNNGSSKKLFSPRELELLTYFAQGHTIESTAKALSLSPYTIAAHRRKMFSKAKCNNISELLAYARSIEII